MGVVTMETMTMPETVKETLYARLSADGTVQVHRAHLATEIGCSERTVDRALKVLRDLGTIEIITGGRFGAPTVYRMEQPHSATPPVDNSATQRDTPQRDTEKTQVAQRDTAPHMCMARCGYPLDQKMRAHGDTMHAWCSLGVTGHHVSDRVKIAAIRQDRKDNQ